MPTKPLDTSPEVFDKRRSEARVGHVYRHFKGGQYRFLNLATLTDSGEEAVVYRDGDRLFVRRSQEFFGDVEHEGQRVPRFVHVPAEPAPYPELAQLEVDATRSDRAGIMREGESWWIAGTTSHGRAFVEFDSGIKYGYARISPTEPGVVDYWGGFGGRWEGTEEPPAGGHGIYHLAVKLPGWRIVEAHSARYKVIVFLEPVA